MATNFDDAVSHVLVHLREQFQTDKPIVSRDKIAEWLGNESELTASVIETLKLRDILAEYPQVAKFGKLLNCSLANLLKITGAVCDEPKVETKSTARKRTGNRSLSSADFDNGRSVLATLAKRSTVEGFRKAMRSRKYKLSNTLMGQLFDALMAEKSSSSGSSAADGRLS